ncbi:protein EARLY-RESPONSIVE TO DEHYDRATION 7, chloroplastic-like [Punica granatum]|uniref:Senescence domain-containing protein n=2 Tax=Punica granatum TaxID=22663 RepID=A0A218W6D8_PUNGR|nr:protein EARLY-RESPONSIVE TO DEHYDRATION 7, chloroplastic-like [Punica granatum]OWM68206.1 hypothetical protein CDL15_Pgr004688 [Punica granatum]PKI68204.1 hypothetical protein CRG98_011403 [Punica granatum]
MSSQKPRPSLYPEVIDSGIHPNPNPGTSASSNLYPSFDMKDMVENLFPEGHSAPHHQVHAYDDPRSPSAPPESTEETLIRVPGVMLHLIDKEYSVELACGDLTITVLRQGVNTVAVLAQVADEIQWPLTKDEVGVRVDESHYFFSLCSSGKAKSVSSSSDEDEGRVKKRKAYADALLSYGLTIASKGQEGLLKELDAILDKYSSFSVQKVSEKAKKVEVLDSSLVKDTTPAELESSGKKKEMIEEQSAAYWTTLAPNVEDYSGITAKLIAAGSGQLIRGILWCGDVTVERLKWGNEVLKKKMSHSEKREISPQTLKRIKRAKKMTKMTRKVATGVLSGVVGVSGFFTSKVANSSAGKKFFGMLPGEIVLASLDGFSKVCDAVEVAGKNVMSTSSTVTTGLVSHRYGEEAGRAASEGLDAAGHAVGTAWAVFKIRQALNPKSVIKPSSLAKSAAKAAAAEAKSKAKKSK